MIVQNGKFKNHVLTVLSAKKVGLDTKMGKYLVFNLTIGRIGLGDSTKAGATEAMIYIAESGDYDFGDFESEDLINIKIS